MTLVSLLLSIQIEKFKFSQILLDDKNATSLCSKNVSTLSQMHRANILGLFLWNLNIREMMHKKRKLWNYSFKECNIINSFSKQKLLWRLWIIPKSHLQNFSLSLHTMSCIFFCKSMVIFLQLDFKKYLLKHWNKIWILF